MDELKAKSDIYLLDEIGVRQDNLTYVKNRIIELLENPDVIVVGSIEKDSLYESGWFLKHEYSLNLPSTKVYNLEDGKKGQQEKIHNEIM